MNGVALLVEDNESHIELITDELVSALPGWTIEVASTLADARRRLDARSYDLFLLDFRLPTATASRCCATSARAA
jgi:DNA-binding response OmpR family regulator